ncbi:hypothetical protein AKJ51_00330 [candidate division MSBL1 archaeon SCGC-AAA382A20]|uniref:Uncharacterized protein n=1 Tax=candidate division MSBL1 archaeon SCGC-AAA382A20 TaxID=1698280 RepID=A0A133VMR3_9EURY|nr:hypothetical protein AKJ51_00330 [candidate division MSBL1 archaeon SCGC-AAA382A20]
MSGDRIVLETEREEARHKNLAAAEKAKSTKHKDPFRLGGGSVKPESKRLQDVKARKEAEEEESSETNNSWEENKTQIAIVGLAGFVAGLIIAS